MVAERNITPRALGPEGHRLSAGARDGVILAVDGGASKTDVWVVAADGTLLGTARGAGSNHQFSGLEGAMDALGGTISHALGSAGLDPGPRPVAGTGVYCLAGVDLPVDEERLGRALAERGWSADDVLRNDTMAVLRAGVRSGWGVGIVCGSGLNCTGLAPDGSVQRFPSLAELSGDFAPGGSWLGVRALGLALRGRDGRGGPTVLGELVPARFGLPDPEAVLTAVYTGELDYGRLFELAEVCLDAAEAGDGPATAAVELLADEVVAMANAAVTRLGATADEVEVVLGGGLFDGDHPRFSERVRAGISALRPPGRVPAPGGAPRARGRPVGARPTGGRSRRRAPSPPQRDASWVTPTRPAPCAPAVAARSVPPVGTDQPRGGTVGSSRGRDQCPRWLRSFGRRSFAVLGLTLITVLPVAVGGMAEPANAATSSPALTGAGAPGQTPLARTDLPPATLPTAGAVLDSRPASCPTPTNDPNTGSGPASATGQFPWPPAPAGTSAADWLADPHTPATAIPERPANWSQGGGDVKLTSARSSDPALAGNPQELCGVEGNSADTAWQTTTGRPTTVLAVTDSGIEWCDPALVDKIYLNRDALPPPENAAGQTEAELAGAAHRAAGDPYDLDGTGIFNVEQYASDPRVAKPYFCAAHGGDGFGYTGISAADLIATFGTPGSPHAVERTGPAGFTDAIAGWNFVDDDNDPYDAVHYGHGTGTAEDAAAAAGTVAQEVGACPNCMIMPLKVGDSFITSGNAFAEAALFAVDSGASVIQEALGTYDVTATDTEAVTYAEDHGVPVVASAADEESEHHNLPAVLENTIVVNSVTHASSFTPPSYLFLNGCTNVGANISVSVESTSCSSEATGKTGGIVGLAESAAAAALADHAISAYPGLQTASGAPVALSANEITQLVTMSADDIDFAKAAPPTGPAHNNAVSTGLPLVTTVRDPTKKGFDPTSGYGRIDAARLVQWIASGRIPPQAEVDGLPWYQVLTPSDTLTVSGLMGTTRSPSWHYEVQVAAGETPRPSAWRVVASGTGTGVRHGELARIPLSEVAPLFPKAVHLDGTPATPNGQPDPDRYLFTVRLVVQDADGMVGMARRAEFLHQDPSLLGGAPVRLPSSVVAPPVLAPIGPGGTNALLVAAADGTVHAYGSNGQDLPGWPVRTGPDTGFHPGETAYGTGIAGPHGEIVGGVAVGDLADASGHDLDIVATDLTGRVWAWNAQGQLLPGWPVRTDGDFSGPGVDDLDNEVLRGILGAPVLGDLTGTGTLDVVAAAMDRHVYAWGPGGSAVPGWPVEVVDPKEVQSVDPADGHVTFAPGAGGDTGSKLVDTPALAQLVPGGPPEVVVTSNEQYAGPPNASLGLLGTLFSLTGKLQDAANSRVYAIWPDGSQHPASAGAPDPPGYPNPGAFLPGWPVAIADLDPNLLPDIGDGASNGPAVATGPDGAPLIAVQSDVGPVYVLRADGSDALGTSGGLPNVLVSSPPGAKSNSTGVLGTSVPALGVPIIAPFGPASATGGPLDVLSAAESAGELFDVSEPASQSPHDSQLDAWDASTGSFVAGFPQVMGGLQFFDQPLVADLTGSKGQAYAVEASSDSDLRAFDADGREAPGFPKLTGGWVTGGAVFGPLGTGADQVVATGTREGELFVWQTGAPASGPRGTWPQIHQNLANTGDFTPPAPG